ncbi:MAG: UvrB/UvrC motif-containing protein [Actinomycetota bacterium]|nr:UvrB/UvrC motif-containing protein [Actinomycetota bacterium]
MSGPGREGRRRLAERVSRFQLASPPFTQEVADEIRRLRDAKEAAITEQRFEEAAALRDRERRLLREARRFEDAWRMRDEPPPAVRREPRRIARIGPGAVALAVPPIDERGRLSRRPTALFLLGLLLFAVAFAIGVVVGLAASA